MSFLTNGLMALLTGLLWDVVRADFVAEGTS